MRLLLPLLLLLPSAFAQDALPRLSSNYVEGRLHILMTEVAQDRYNMACRKDPDSNYCFSLSQALAGQSANNRKELVLNYVDRIFPNARFAAECRANIDHVIELLNDHPWEPVQCDDDDTFCRNTLEYAFGTNRPEVVESALIGKLETCHYNGPSTLPF